MLYSGTQMIYKDINTSGVTTLKLFGNELSATSLGIVVIFIGAIIVIATIRWRLSETSRSGGTTEFLGKGRVPGAKRANSLETPETPAFRKPDKSAEVQGRTSKTSEEVSREYGQR